MPENISKITLQHRTPVMFVPMCSSSPNQPLISHKQSCHCYHTIFCLLEPIFSDLKAFNNYIEDLSHP